MAYISQTSIQEVTDRLDAVAVVSDYVQMEKKGGRYWACCPFHREKTGSFTVNPDIKTYYCFGCHKGGTVISFVMEMDKLTFPEAIEQLAKRFGVELVYENSGAGTSSAEDEARKKEKEELFELYRRISNTFHHFFLKNHEAEAAKLYIIDRGICNEMVERFRLGYAPADRYWLNTFLVKKGYSGDFLKSSGLFSARNPDQALFSGRLMFPIADRQGRTVAFGGRFLEGVFPVGEGYTPPKYINSPELKIYKKGETLYALDLALPEIRGTKTAYVAEGYMDVIALHQAGVTNALAPLGTAFTDEQAKLLRRWAEKAILFFDSDEAGRAAALKGIFTCRKNGLECAVVMPENEDGNGQDSKDPADILRYHGPEALQKKAKCFINDFDYLLFRARSLYNASGGSKTEGKARAVAFLFPYIDLLESEVAKGSCFEAAADAFGLLHTVVAEDYRRSAGERRRAEHPAGVKHAEDEHSRQPEKTIRLNDELSLLITAAIDFFSARPEKLFMKFRAALETNEIDDPDAKEIFIALEECIRYGETGMDELLARITSPELKKFIVERSASGEFSINAEQLITDGIKKIRGKRLEHRQEEIIIKLRSLKNSETNGDEVRELLAEKMQIDNELNLLKQGR